VSSEAFLAKLFLDLVEIHCATFATTGIARRFGLEAFIDKPAHIDQGEKKDQTDHNTLYHTAKVI
jgi:hypothetical protein